MIRRLLLFTPVTLLIVYYLTTYALETVQAVGHGLRGDYYSGIEASAPSATRVDKNFDFVFPDTPRGIPPADYWVRWTGELFAPIDGEYTLLIRSDDGARLWIKDQLLLDEWKIGRPALHKTQVFLAKGWHPIRLDYCRYKGSSLMQLAWLVPGKHIEDIPVINMRPYVSGPS
jgi:hypothetical protein